MYIKITTQNGDEFKLPINPEIEKLGYDDIRIRNYTEYILYEIEKIVKDKNINNDIAIKKIRELFNSIEFEGIKKVEKLKEK